MEVADRARNGTAVRSLIVLGAVLLLLATLAVQVRDTVIDGDEFADRVVTATSTPEVEQEIAGRIVDAVVRIDDDLLVYRPVIQLVVDTIVRSTAFDDVMRFGLVDLHRSVVTGADDTLTIRLSELLLLIKVSLTKVDPEATALIPDELTDTVISFRTDPSFVDAAQFADRTRLAAFALPVLALGSFAGALWLARRRRAAAIDVGVAVVLTGMLLAALEPLARAVVVARAEDGTERIVTSSVWDAFMGDLIRPALALVVVGGIIAGVAALGRRHVDDASVRATARAIVRPPATRRAGVIWSVVVGAIGVVLVLEWQTAVRLAVTGIGAGLVVVAVAELRLASARPRRAAPARDDEPWWVFPARVFVVLVALVGLGLALIAIAESGGDDELEAAGDPGCNGSVLLCDRPLDEVAFATTHNSMAAANDGFTMGYQTVGIIEQLDLGYRGLLIDAYFGLDADDRVVTDRAPLGEEERAAMVANFGESVVRSAEALNESLIGSGSDRDVYLCHSFCEIGAVKMSDELARVARWLDAHPREVLVIIVQDEGPRDTDIERVFREAGLLDMVHTQEADEPWPSLGEMIRSDRRIWVAAEHRPGDIAWYHDAFDFVQDTPFSPTRPEDFSCELLRGSPESPLFLINHWLSPASPSNADIANSRPVLERRLADCELERDRFPNLIAVDFADRGDTLAVVDELNGIEEAP